ncbi:MAG: GNAT family N-acetyltransferase [Gaiellaceae bacterium]|nr:GNAT family N-acetyltransferase [Gaiellaceae bacterium]
MRALASALADGSPPAALIAFLERTLLDQPWADPALPSLIYEESGEILGTIGASTRRMRFLGTPVRVVVSAYFWAHPEARARGVGARLLRELLSGPQDVTLTDAATPEVRRMWEALGGTTVHLGCFSYVRVLRPARLAAERLLRTQAPRVARLAASAVAPLDALASYVPRLRLRVEPSDATSEPLTAAAVVDHLPSVAASLSLVPDYDVPYLEWLFAQLSDIDRSRLPWLQRREPGELWAEVVTRRERVLGWYVCHLRRGGPCRVLQIAAPPRHMTRVVRHLCLRASELGATAVVGRLEPRILQALEEGIGRVLYRGRGRMLVHAKNPALVTAILRGDALLTSLDGEWWAS